MITEEHLIELILHEQREEETRHWLAHSTHYMRDDKALMKDLLSWWNSDQYKSGMQILQGVTTAI